MLPTRHDVIWTTPSQDALGSMPLGNGETGANAWITGDGRLQLFLSRTDAWDDAARLVKLGRLALEADLDLAAAARAGFEQRLHLATGEMTLRLGPAGAPALTLRLWADAHRSLLWIEAEAHQPVTWTLHLSSWRTERRELAGTEAGASMKQDGVHEQVFESPDRVLEPDQRRPGQIGLFHRNETSPLPDLLEHQALAPAAGRIDDVLANRTFGTVVESDPPAEATGGELADPWLATAPAKAATFRLATHTDRTPTLHAWSEAVQTVLEEARTTGPDAARAAHRQWWATFWPRSYIEVSGDAVADRISQVYCLQRYVTACAGRGRWPIKFNGSIFTVDGPPERASNRENPESFNADYRRWGGGYWFQNQRLIYWPLLATGDFEMMAPWFEHFERVAELCRWRVRAQWDCDGLFFPETMTLWGTYRNDNYGYERPGPENLPDGVPANRYIRWYWQGGLELATLMLEHRAHTGDTARWTQRYWPIVRDVVRFYASYYRDFDEAGTRHFTGTQSLETWHDADDPTPDIAGLRHVLGRLLELPESERPGVDRTWLAGFAASLPAVPTGPDPETGAHRILPAARYGDLKNMENCSLYAVFPYPLGALGGELHEAAEGAWPHRRMKAVGGWFQDAVHAAMLGRARDAADRLAAAWAPDLAPELAGTHLKWPQHAGLRFPAFFGPNCNWVPDQDHAGVNMLALQKMCLQSQHGKLRVLPAWPQHWNVSFRLHAPGPAVVECEYVDGALRRLDASPAERADELVPPAPATTS